MLKDMILNFDGKPPDSFLTGAKLPDRFELPDNILVFMHDWFPPQFHTHGRYMLIIPAVPIEYRIDNDVHYRVEPGHVMFSPPCQNRALQVALYCLNMPSLSSAQKAKLQQIMTATGRSESDPVYVNGVEDKSASRRVEFKFSLKDSEMIEEMNRILSGQ